MHVVVFVPISLTLWLHFSISGYEFAYTQAPKNLQGAVMGIFLATTGLGNYVSTAIIAIIEAATTESMYFILI